MVSVIMCQLCVSLDRSFPVSVFWLGNVFSALTLLTGNSVYTEFCQSIYPATQMITRNCELYIFCLCISLKLDIAPIACWYTSKNSIIFLCNFRCNGHALIPKKLARNPIRIQAQFIWSRARYFLKIVFVICILHAITFLDILLWICFVT